MTLRAQLLWSTDLESGSRDFLFATPSGKIREGSRTHFEAMVEGKEGTSTVIMRSLDGTPLFGV